MKQAKELLQNGNYTCVLCKDDVVYTSTLTGIAPMVQFLSLEIDLRGFHAADRIVGKAAALLFVLAGVDCVYAPVMSRDAVNVFSLHHISCEYEQLTEQIINRAGTGPCPMEEAVSGIEDPQQAFESVKTALTRLQQKQA